MPLLPFELGGRVLAIDALSVVEILGRREWLAIPRAPETMPGALAWRGRALVLLELGPLLGLAQREGTSTRERNLVIRLDDDFVVLGVDRVLEARRATLIGHDHAVELALPRLGEFEFEDMPVPVIDIDRWVRSKRRSA
jgi:chemotaxis signal transduction protein